MKKTILTLSSLAIVASPILIVASCSQTGTSADKEALNILSKLPNSYEVTNEPSINNMPIPSNMNGDQIKVLFNELNPIGEGSNFTQEELNKFKFSLEESNNIEGWIVAGAQVSNVSRNFKITGLKKLSSQENSFLTKNPRGDFLKTFTTPPVEFRYQLLEKDTTSNITKLQQILVGENKIDSSLVAQLGNDPYDATFTDYSFKLYVDQDNLPSIKINYSEKDTPVDVRFDLFKGANLIGFRNFTFTGFKGSTKDDLNEFKKINETVKVPLNRENDIDDIVAKPEDVLHFDTLLSSKLSSGYSIEIQPNTSLKIGNKIQVGIAFKKAETLVDVKIITIEGFEETTN